MNQIKVKVKADTIWMHARRYKEGDEVTLSDYTVERTDKNTGDLVEKTITAEQQFSKKTMVRLTPKVEEPVAEIAPVSKPVVKKATKKKATKKVEKPEAKSEDQSVI